MSNCTSSPPVQVGEGFRIVPSGLRLGAATAADHYPVFDLLQAVFKAPTAGEFQSQLEDPFYEPNQRLVVRRGAKVVAHVRMCHREMHFGPLILPVTSLTELATEPAWRRQGLATALLADAERQMIEGGAAIGLVRTDVPDFFLRRGWVHGGLHSWSEAGARDILAQLSASKREVRMLPGFDDMAQRPPQLSTRIWRHVERSALERLYAQNCQRAYGPLVRSHEYWSWLVSRRAYDSIYVTVQGPDRRELDDRPIVAYAVLRGGRVVELFGAPDCPQAVTCLLARICGEAIERDVHDVTLDLGPDHPLHAILTAAGGEHYRRERVGGQALLAKVFDPWKLLEQLLPELAIRAQQQGLELPVELVVQEGEQRRRIVVTRRAQRLEEVRSARSPLVCAPGGLSELLLGHWDVPTGVERGRFQSNSAAAILRATALFPRQPWWRPAFEEMAS